MNIADGPEIVGVETEAEILFQLMCAKVERAVRIALQQDLTVADGAHTMAATAVTGVLQALRFMSGRQAAVLLAQQADTGVSYVIREPPHYSAEEIAEAS